MANPNLYILLPPGLLAIAACLFLFSARFWRQNTVVWARFCLAVFFTAATTVFITENPINATDTTTTSVLVDDWLATSLGWIGLAIGVCFAAMKSAGASSTPHPAESFAMLLLSVAGTMIVATAQELVLLSVGLQLALLPLGLMLFISDLKQPSREAALKYAVTNGLSMCLLVYGFVLYYGVSGTTFLTQTNELPPLDSSFSPLATTATILIFCGLAIQLSAIPFQHSAMDIAEGTDAWTAGVVMLLPKIAATAVVLRFCLAAQFLNIESGVFVLLLLASLSILGGSTAALLQTRLHRTVMSLTVAQIGYLLLSAAVLLRQQSAKPSLVNASLWQLSGMAIAVVGLLGCFAYLSGNGRRVEYLEELTGLSRGKPWLACSIALFLLSLAGFPPLWGFWSRAAIGLSAMAMPTEGGTVVLNLGFLTASIASIMGSIFTAATCVRVLQFMFFQEPLKKHSHDPAWPMRAVSFLLAFAILAGGLVPLFFFQ